MFEIENSLDPSAYISSDQSVNFTDTNVQT